MSLEIVETAPSGRRLEPAHSQREWKVLVAEDDESTRYLLCRFLERAGYRVEAAADGEEAWNALLVSHYDLLLSDHNMPRLRGLDLVARLRAAGLNLPVIIDSASL